MFFRQRLRRWRKRIIARFKALIPTRIAGRAPAPPPRTRVSEITRLPSEPSLHPPSNRSGISVSQNSTVGQPLVTPVTNVSVSRKEVVSNPTPLSGQTTFVGASAITPPTAARASTTSGWKNLTGLFKLLLSRPASAVGPLRATIGDLVECISIFEEVSNGRKEFRELQSELERLFQDLQEYYSTGEVPPATASIGSLCKSIREELAQLTSKQSRGMSTRLLTARRDADDVLRCYRRIQGYLHRLYLNANLSIWRTIDEQTTNDRLDHMSPSLSARYDSNLGVLELQRGECTQGTRVDLLAQVLNWASSSAAAPVYWLNGMAGVGKTTICYSLCAELDAKQKLGASFFCSRLLPECRDVNRIIPSIAYQLARFSQPFRYALSRVLEAERDLHTQRLPTQFERLIAQPIEEVRDSLPQGIVVVIDALDECENKDNKGQIFEVLSTGSTNLPVKFFLASRPEPEMRDQLRGPIGDGIVLQFVLHELDKGVVQSDIETYLRGALHPIRPSEPELAQLVQRAGILFIYASTVARYIGRGNFGKNPRQRLRNVLSSPSRGGRNLYKELDDLYALILDAALDDPDLDGSERDDMREVLHTVICAREPLLIDALSELLSFHDTERVEAALRPLWSVLHIVGSNESVTPLHGSFPEYMFDSTRSKKFYCNPEAHHLKLTRHCFACIEATAPQFNICNLESSYLPDDMLADLNTRIGDMISTGLFYACRYWVAHLERTNLRTASDVHNLVFGFLSTRLLLWMEVMNLKKLIGSGVEIIRRAEVWCSRSRGKDNLLSLLRDAWRFLIRFASHTVSQSTPHIYVSMLACWPSYSPIARHYAGRLRSAVQGTAAAQSSLILLATWSIGGIATSLTWSPDSKNVAFVSKGRIYLRNSFSGQETFGPLNQGSEPAVSVAFSPNGECLASGFADGTVCVQVWDSQSSDWQDRFDPPRIQKHAGRINSVAFSPDGSRVVSCSEDGSLHIWDARTGGSIIGPLVRHTHSVQSVAYSPDGSSIASGSKDGTILLWDSQNGELLLDPLEGHTHWVNSVAFSPDGAFIVSGSSDKTIRMWDAHEGQQVIEPIEGHLHSVTSVTFSPDGTQVVSGSGDKTIRVWNAQTGEPVLSPLEGHTHWIGSVAFSPDGTRVISGSGDHTIRMWDVRAGPPLPNSLDGHLGTVHSVAFSPDGTYIVSGSRDRTVQIWDAENGQPMSSPRVGQVGRVKSIALSSDGTRVASGSSNRTIRVWDIESGELIVGPLRGHTGTIHSIAFSPDGTRIVSGSQDRTIRIWDLNIGQQIIPPLIGHTDWVKSVAFSSDGARIVSGSGDMSIRTWDVQSGQPRLTINSDPERGRPVTSVAFSPDGTCVASGSADDTIRLWNSHTGQRLLDPLEGHTGWVHSVSFSADGTRIVSASSDKSIRVWDAQTGELLPGPLKGHKSSVLSAVFSPNGTRIVSGSSDQTISVWNAEMPASNEVSVIQNPFGATHPTESPRLSQPEHLSRPALFRWEVAADGWVVDTNDRSRLLMWIPPDLCSKVLSPRQLFVISKRDDFLRLCFDRAAIGPRWAECYSPR